MVNGDQQTVILALDWARSATCWLRGNNITTGYGNTGGYAPQVAVSRGQMAAFLDRIGGTIERRWMSNV